jgi:hypothetical protein
MSKALRIFGCGGAGVNLVSHYFGKETAAGTAELAPALIDTSRSNLRGRKIDEAATYLVEGLDGSGKIRSENYEEINKTIKQILVQIPPGDFNLVVFSASGGSGSVVGPLLLKALNERKLPAIAIVVGTDESTIAAENTLKTIKSLELVAKNSDLPVVMSFHKNDLGGRRSETDRAVWSVISCLSILTSGENMEMDYRDLVHWVQYTKVNGGRSQLATMHVATSADHMKRITAPLSVASLYGDPDQEHLATSSDYQSVGYADLSGTDFDQVHFVIGVNDLQRIGQDLKAQVSGMMEERNARIDVDSLLEDGDSEGDVVL